MQWLITSFLFFPESIERHYFFVFNYNQTPLFNLIWAVFFSSLLRFGCFFVSLSQFGLLRICCSSHSFHSFGWVRFGGLFRMHVIRHIDIIKWTSNEAKVHCFFLCLSNQQSKCDLISKSQLLRIIPNQNTKYLYHATHFQRIAFTQLDASVERWYVLHLITITNAFHKSIIKSFFFSFSQLV